LKAYLPAEAPDGEPLVTLDTGELYIGRGEGQAPLLIGGGTETVGEALALAQAANAYIADACSDGKVAAGEKKALLQEWEVVQEEATAGTGSLIIQASSFGITSGAQYTAFVNAFNDLDTYLNTTLGIFAQMTASTAVNRTTFKFKWKAYYAARTNLVNAISDKAKAAADAAQTVADAAQAKADAAKAAMDDLADDGKITSADKKKAKQQWAQIQTEGNAATGTLPVHAAAIGVASADILAFNSAYTALNNYLNTTLRLFQNMAVTTAVNRQDWDDAWNNYYNAKVALQKDIANQAAQTASVDADGMLKGAGVVVSNEKIEKSHLQGAGKAFAAGAINGSGRPVINLDDDHAEGTYGRTKAAALDNGVPRKEVQHLFPTARLENTGDKLIVNNMVG
jgi:hypothetical protein